jgi:hypothetical protein
MNVLAAGRDVVTARGGLSAQGSPMKREAARETGEGLRSDSVGIESPAFRRGEDVNPFRLDGDEESRPTRRRRRVFGRIFVGTRVVTAEPLSLGDLIRSSA